MPRVKRDALKLNLIDSNGNEGSAYVRALNQDGNNILNDLLVSDRMKGVSLAALRSLELDYFKT